MSDDNQILIPDSFIALFVPPGKVKPTESREHVAERYGFCEDLAQMLTETARTMEFRLGITPRDVLERVALGLRAEGSGVAPFEGAWVLRRLAELLSWDDPGPDGLGVFADVAPGGGA